jgi:hypothetical protein
MGQSFLSQPQTKACNTLFMNNALAIAAAAQAPEAPQAPASAPEIEHKICPECGVSFPVGGRGLGKTFCCKEHRVAFNNRAKAEGAVLVAFVKAWTLTRHAKPGSDKADLCGEARRELTAIASMLNDADKAAGRPDATVYVKALMESGTLYCDRRRG